MKSTLLLTATLILNASLFAADSSLKDEVITASKKLGDKANYSWKTTTAVPESARFRPGPSEGQTEKDGYTYYTMSFGENTTKIFIKGDKAAFTNMEGEWQSASEAEGDQGPGRFMAMIVKNFKTPAVQAAEIAADVKEFKKDGDVISGELTEDGAKRLLTMRPRGGAGGEGPTTSEAKGSVKCWLKDGLLSKVELKVMGKISFNGTERDMDRTTTTEIKDIGTTKVTVPEEAKKKLS